MSDESADVIELEVGKIAAGGGCVGRGPDGRVVFVRHALPGERVIAKITATTKSFLRADAVEVLRPSTDRVTAPCPHAGPGRCGGCDFQHATLPAQRRLKASLISEQLLRLAGVDMDVEVESVDGDVNGLGWRTRIRLGVDDSGNVGFRQHRSHHFEYVTNCPIARSEINDVGALEARWIGAQELEVVVAPGTDEALVAIDVPPKGRVRLPQIDAGLVVNGQTVQAPGALQIVVSGVTFRISAGVFWQVHIGAAPLLAEVVREAMGAGSGDHVVDLYAGAGLFSVLLSDDVGPDGSVLAIERDKHACADAEHNGRQKKQMRVQRGSVTPRLVERSLGKPDLMVMDPSREGAGTAVMAALAARPPSLRRLVYVACDPGSFSRDLRVLLDAGWTLSRLQAFDIFPMTEHVELVATIIPPQS